MSGLMASNSSNSAMAVRVTESPFDGMAMSFTLSSGLKILIKCIISVFAENTVTIIHYIVQLPVLVPK